MVADVERLKCQTAGIWKNSAIRTLVQRLPGCFLIEDNYVIVHVGDTRAYQIGNEITQLTTDQTFVAREIERGTMTPEQAKKDKRRNMLLQCVGASEKVEPEIITGAARCGSYMLCSDGFRHEISAEEIRQALAPERLVNRQTMHKKDDTTDRTDKSQTGKR